MPRRAVGRLLSNVRRAQAGQPFRRAARAPAPSPDPLPIDKGVPLPPRPARQSWKVGLAETVRRLEVGDSFVYPNAESAVSVARRLGVKLESRPIGDGAYRIWRVA